MKHDSNPLHMFLEKVLNVLKIKYPTLQKCVYLTDRIYGISLRLLMGKTLVMVLEVLSNALLVVQASGSLQEPINTWLKMFEWCRENINAIEFIFVYHDEIESQIVDYGLKEKYLTWLKVLGTRSFHWYKPCSKT